MTEAPGAQAGTPPAARIASLDVLRGFAVLGILIMNVQGFSMPGDAYDDPTAWGDLTGANYVVWWLSHLFADTKFISIFSFLFGAGVCLFADRAARRGADPTRLHFRRMRWLLLFGLVHAYLLWVGDILVAYAVSGFVIFRFRDWNPRRLLVGGLGFFAVGSVAVVGLGYYLGGLPQSEIDRLLPPIAEEVAAYRGAWLAQMSQRATDSLGMHFLLLPVSLFWRCTGAMMVGMALYRRGVLSASRSDGFYKRLAFRGLCAGGIAVLVGVWFDVRAQWNFPESQTFHSQFNYWGGLSMAAGYVGLVMLGVRRGWLPRLQDRLAATGRMAFTNYVMQTLICTTLFYGHGFGLFGSVERWKQALIVVAVWLAQLWWSPLWLARFRQGPLEGIWRRLTYGRPLTGG